jgi:DNA polymerase-3 subunit epsilon
MPANLSDLEILALDCQAIGANPRKGHLLEIGWLRTCAADTPGPAVPNVRAYLASLPEGAEIPPAVQRVTGISPEALAKALDPANIWQKVCKTAKAIAAADQMHKCPAIIHYARFEAPFLRDLHDKSNHGDDFPFRIICTHEISKRLLPGLPRRGLRAIAGYFGHSVPPSRRSADHAVATAVIWQNLVSQLRADPGIQELDELTDWLRRTTPQKRAGRVYPMEPETRLRLPEKPGIYRMLRSNKDLLYIGKATSLKQRVNSYFRQKGAQAEHTLEMLSQAAGLEVTLTGSALEAAVLESDEIKQHAPPYNVALQKGRRKLAFLTRDLQKFSGEPDKIHCLGPLPAGKTADAMTAFGSWHTNRRSMDRDEVFELGTVMLGVPPAYAPEPECLAEGMDLFVEHHLAHLSRRSALRNLSGLGHRLWRERLAELAAAQAEEAEGDLEADSADSDPEIEEAPSWTPETVARAIEKFTMRSALLIRRARWLCLLSESSLAWEARDTDDHRKILLRIESGEVAQRRELPGGAEVPMPAGYTRRMADRQKIFDLTTYERLRVVTTELRRLVAGSRHIEIRLRPNATLSRRQLARLLPWV